MKINIVVEGDSIPEGYPLSASGAMPYQLNALLQARSGSDTYTVTNIAYRNRKMTEMDSRYAAFAAPLYDATADHNIFIMWGGGNDIYFLAGQQAATIAAYDSLVSKALATGFTVWVCNIIQRGENASGTIATWRTEAAAINAHFLADTTVTNLDVKALYPSFDWTIDPWTTTAQVGVRPPEYEDWAHPSAVGHATVAAYIETLVPGEGAESYLYQRVNGVTKQYPLYLTGDVPVKVNGTTLYLRYAETGDLKIRVNGTIHPIESL